MGFGVIALTSRRSSAVYTVVEFVRLSRPRYLGSVPRPLGRVRLLLCLGSSERSVVGMLSVVPFARLEWFPCTYLQLMLILMLPYAVSCSCSSESFHAFTTDLC